MKAILFMLLLVSPWVAEAQYKMKKMEGDTNHIDYSLFKNHHTQEIVLDAGFATVARGIGLLYYVRGEYFINKKFSGRLNFFINSFKPNPKPQSYLQIAGDVAYHFYQEKRYDIYSYLGIGFHRFKTESSISGAHHDITPTINSGVGGRYRVTPSFGVQLELGRTSTLGAYLSLGFLGDS